MDISILNIKNDLEQNYLKNSGGTITGDLTVNGDINGNAESASKLETPRTISLTGDVTGSTNFDGSSDISIDTSLSVSEVQTWEATKNDIHIKIVKKGNVCKMEVSTTLAAKDGVATLVQLSDMPNWAKCDFESTGEISNSLSAKNFQKILNQNAYSPESYLFATFAKVDESTYRMAVLGGNPTDTEQDVSTFLVYLGNGHNIQLDTESVIDGFPVGSIYVNSTNTSPSWIFGGEWELIDKEFEPYKNSDEGVASLDSSNTTSATVQVVRQGHTVMIRTEFVPKVVLNDSTHDMLTFKTSTFGAKESDFYFQRCFVGQTDGGNGFLNIYLMENGTLSVRDVMSKSENGTIAAGQNCMVTIVWEMPWDYMDDSYCNKFYWKRIS